MTESSKLEEITQEPKKTYRPANLVSKLCFKKILFSALAQAILSVNVRIWMGRLLGIEEKKSKRVRTFGLVH
jgi:hypothetical protein